MNDSSKKSKEAKTAKIRLAKINSLSKFKARKNENISEQIRLANLRRFKFLYCEVMSNSLSENGFAKRNFTYSATIKGNFAKNSRDSLFDRESRGIGALIHH